MQKIKFYAAIASLSIMPFVEASVVGQEVISDLKARAFDAKMSVWGVTQLGNNMDQIGIYQVPFFNGQQTLVTPVSDNLSPAKAFATQYQALIASAEKSVDIASLDSQPGLTLDAIRDGLTQLDKKNKPIEVRLIFGNIAGAANYITSNNPLSARKTIGYITSNLKKDSKLVIYVGIYRAGYSYRSWNHAKILVVDSQNILTGGVNFLDSGYASDINPVNDLSLYYPNMNLGLPANKFLDNEWSYLCSYKNDTSISGYLNRGWSNNASGSIQMETWKNGQVIDENCPADLGSKYNFSSNHENEVDPSLNYAISTARLGAVANWKQDTSDIAQISMIDHANSYVKISQQAVYYSTLAKVDKAGGYEVFPINVLKALCSAMSRGVAVSLMTSGEMGQPGVYPSSFKWPKTPVFPSYSTTEQLKRYLVTVGGCNLMDVDNPERLQIRINSNKQNLNANPSDYRYFPNHSKVVIVDSKDQDTGQVDGKLVYVGSHNTYDQSHAEYGVIVDSNDFVSRFEQQFWDYNWNHAK